MQEEKGLENGGVSHYILSMLFSKYRFAQRGVYPIIPLKGTVVFPGMTMPIQMPRNRRFAFVEDAIRQSQNVVLLLQKDENEDFPGPDGFYGVGVRARVVNVSDADPGVLRFVVEVVDKVRVDTVLPRGSFLMASAEHVQENLEPENDPRVPPLVAEVAGNFSRFLKMQDGVIIEDGLEIANPRDPVAMISGISLTLTATSAEKKQKVLEADSLFDKLKTINSALIDEMGRASANGGGRRGEAGGYSRRRREAYLNEKLAAIKNELGEMDDDNELDELASRIEEAGLPDEAHKKVKYELGRLRKMHFQSSEATVLRGYIDAVLELPWNKRSALSFDLEHAKRTLDNEHYALLKVKDRILEFLAVQKRTGGAKGTILCLMGPPGVGKTSLGQAIAKATGRIFQKMSLGGVRDEADIRGHRRTYVGSQWGRVLASMKKAGVVNPLIMLDEIDKMGKDSFHGDPSAALLEVLDPEQNKAFNDHYLDLDYDLSGVMFIATANSYNIPRPLLDRMEVLELSGYTDEEKYEIAKLHIIPKLLGKNGLRADEIHFSADALKEIVRYYTRESGVRSLERNIDKVMRKVVKKSEEDSGPDLFELKSEDAAGVVKITAKNVAEYLGARKVIKNRFEKKDQIGLVNGLAWTEVGGETLLVESVVMEGKGLAVMTGKLGDVMKESVETAKSFVRSRSRDFGINPKIWCRTDIHIHVPEGATPKDGPSAGIAMVVAMVSTLTGMPVRHDVAMTGEVTLRGRVLGVGGLKEKLLAAMRAGAKRVFIPFDNVKDLEEIPALVKEKLEIIPVKNVDEVLVAVLAGEFVPIKCPENFFEDLLAVPAAPEMRVGA